jgi:enoyl reductase-like protein
MDGHARGYHSFEDYHEAILKTYGALRSVPNLILIMESSLRDITGLLSYIDSSWSLKYQHVHMPFDGILLGSRMLVAEEALMSVVAKTLIIDSPGCSNPLE